MEQPNIEENRMGPEKAREEANLLRAKLKEIINPGYELDADDYDTALHLVEELKREAANQDPEEHAKVLRRNQLVEQYGDKMVNGIIQLFSLGAVDKKFHMGGMVDAMADPISVLERLKGEAQKLEK